MLKTQVDYLAYLEQKRHNQMQELEAWRTNRRAEQLKYLEIGNQAVKTSADIKQNAQRIANERWQMERANEVNRRNAATNRINAINQQRRNFQDWNVALDANRIAARNAETNRLNAQSQERQSYSSLGQYNVAQQRATNEAGIGWMNAQTNLMNAQNAQRQTQLRAQELQLMQSHYRWQDTASMANAASNVVNSIFRNAQTMASTSSYAQFN